MQHQPAPRISVIIPAYNRAALIGDAIRSVLGQSIAAAEIIVADDGSTDGTAEVVRAFGPAVTYLRQDNEGSASSRNLAIRHATGDYLAFLDSDDVFTPDRLEVGVRNLPGDGEVLFSRQRFENISDDEELMTRVAGAGPNWCVTDEDSYVVDAPWQIARGGYLQLNTMLCSRVAFDQVGPFDVALRAGQDEDWFFRASLQHRIRLLPDMLATRRMHDEQVGLHKERNIRSLVQVFTNIVDRAEATGHPRAAAAGRVRLATALSRLANACAARGARKEAVATQWRAGRTDPSKPARFAKVPLLAIGWRRPPERR